MQRPFFLFLLLLLPSMVLAAETININSATLAQLEDIKGVGPTYAQRIIDGRPYVSVDDLLRIKGIGSKTLQEIKSQGYACVDCQTFIPAAPVTLKKPKASAASLPKEEKSDNINIAEAKNLTTDLSQGNPPAGGSNPWFLFFAVLASIIILALLVFVIKTKLLHNHVGS